MKRKVAILRGMAAIMAFLLFVTVSASNLMFSYAGVINSEFNVNTSVTVETDSSSADNLFYYDTRYGTDITNKQAVLQVEMDAATENIRQAEEGSVLLRNENHALPLEVGSRITVFGNGSYNSVGTSSSTAFEAIPSVSLNSALQNAYGADNVNLILSENVYSGLGSTSNTEVVEALIGDVTAYEDTWQTDFNDAAIVMFSRIGSESNESAMYTEGTRHYLGLQPNEQDLLAYLQEEKAAGIFDRIIVLINADQMMELDWLDDYDVDACVLAGLPGDVGFTGLANILTGEATPSGRTVDTYAANSLSAPAMTYAGENTQSWANVDWVHSNSGDYSAMNTSYIDNYVIYAEGIYVGYKYYETRYEDVVMGTGNADSTVGSSTGESWSYTDEVVFPFGYGLSYTTFEQELLGVTYQAETDEYQVQVQVTNTGDVAGMSVIEVYAQTPYGDYEKENLIEKAAIQFVGMEKTESLEPGESVTVTVPVDRYMLASYDSHNAKGYILSAGDYYLSIGENAHDALNNILTAKGYTVSDGMDYDGDASKVHSWNQAELDTETYNLSRFTEMEVTNAFDNADLNYYGIDFTYLSRADWESTYPIEQVAIEVTEEMLIDLDSDWYEQPEDAPSPSDFTQGADNGLTLADMRTVPWEDEETWDALLDQMTIAEMASLLSDNRGNEAIESIGMPALQRNDDGMGVGGTLTAVGSSALDWVSEVMTARTWNKDRFSSRGELLALEATYSGINEIWYGGGDLHRTPIGGRNWQYYSEDGNFGYIVGAYEAKAMQDMGVIYAIKHFALNDQETNRGGLATFATEQAIREIYLRAFEGAFCEGGAMGVMTGFNRIGVSYNATNQGLLTTVLRGEWGYKGHVTTDGFGVDVLYQHHFAEQLVNTVTYCCVDAGNYCAGIEALINAGDGYLLQCLRQATKYNLYAISRTIVQNGLSNTTVVVQIVPLWQTALLTATALFALGFVGCTVASAIFIQKDRRRPDGQEV